MANPTDTQIRSQLLNRRQRLEQATNVSPESQQLQRLLGEVDAALERLNTASYGLCKACNEPIEAERLIADPLVQFCLDHLTPSQQRALEEDLELASQLQTALLPKQTIHTKDWEVSYHYEGAGPVSGDYCDLLSAQDKSLCFIIGDVAGKGVAASLLMAHLHATFRALVSIDLPIDQVVKRANRTFCESTLPTHFATLVCGKASSSGEVEICNAGHPPPLLIHGGEIGWIKATGLPLGMFCEEPFAVSKLQLSPGDTILLYTDGLSEAEDESGTQYGTDRLSKFVNEHYSLPPEELVSACLKDLKGFRAGAPKTDDLTIMAIRRLGSLDS